MNQRSRDEDLLATCWTTAGDAAPLRGGEQSPIPLQERVEAAVTAGFRGFGLVYADLLVAEHLRAHGYDGWYTLEQDTILTEEPRGEGPVADVWTSAEYLRAALRRTR